ncbi:MAG: hypothetical protein H7199_12035 [Burkholderiales bacterium]|nr:hypothetical protein [Flavobacterium sp.]
MKTLKLFLFLLVALPVFNSCSEDNPIKKQATTKSSNALRIMLAEYKKVQGISNRSSEPETFCFEFVYPMTFSYNDGTVVTVTSFDGLIEILSNETSELYLEGIQFPFQVTQQTPNETITLTISSEEEFSSLIESCGIDTVEDQMGNSLCFDIVYPITINTANGQVAVDSFEALVDQLNALGADSELDIIFPISVLYGGQVIIINNLYEFYEMVENCDTCVCTEEYVPVCVQTPSGIVEYANACFAICAGYTQNDFVTCVPSTNCNITNLTIQPSACSTTGTFNVTVNFTLANSSGTQFAIYNSNSQLFGPYNLSDLPITISNYPIFAQDSDFLSVFIVGDTNCSVTEEFASPCVVSCNCSDEYFPVCVMGPNGITSYSNQCYAFCAGYTAADFVDCGAGPGLFESELGSCFFITYPVSVQYQGAVYSVNNDVELLQYASTSGSVPLFVYPITVTFPNIMATTVNSGTEFSNLADANCN